MDYPLCALRRGWWRGERTCFHRDTLTKTGTEREQRSGFAASPCLALHLYYFVLIYFFLFFFCFYSPSCVGEREMFAELLCGAVALVLYVNTLGADFCYDDRYLGEWMTSSPLRYYQHCLHHISSSVRVLSKAILMCSHSSCCHNSQWTASATATFNSRELSFFINTSSLPEGKCQFINRVYGALKSRGVIAMSSWLFVLM